jgi:hypothetical protein
VIYPYWQGRITGKIYTGTPLKLKLKGHKRAIPKHITIKLTTCILQGSVSKRSDGAALALHIASELVFRRTDRSGYSEMESFDGAPIPNINRTGIKVELDGHE